VNITGARTAGARTDGDAGALDDGQTPLEEMTKLAERALLGALLWDPCRLRDVTWLRAGDFSLPAGQAIYATLVGLAKQGTPINIAALPQIMANAQGVHHDVPVGQHMALSGPLLADLLHDAPEAVVPPLDVSPATATVQDPVTVHRDYATLVLEASIRRQVTAMGSRIDQVGQTMESGGYVAHFHTPELVETLARQLDHAAVRLGQLTDQITRAGVADPGDLGIDMRTPERVLSVGATPRYRAPERAEADLIGVCLVSLTLRELATARLTPDDLSHPATAATWTSLTALTHAGGPVDYVLLAARQLRDHAGTTAVHPLRPTILAKLAARADIAVGSAALAEVTRNALLRAADRTQRLLSTVAADPALSGPQLLHTTREVLDRLRADVHRLDDSRHRDSPPAPAHATHRPNPRPVAPAQSATSARRTARPPLQQRAPAAAAGPRPSHHVRHQSLRRT
jgi:hypothetical protein